MSVQDTPIDPAWESEIMGLHEFFEQWLRGESECTSMGRLESVLAPGFGMVTPTGKLLGREALIEGLVQNRGSRPSLRIEIEDPVMIVDEPTIMIARYVEVQRANGHTDRRVSTVVFEHHTGTPNGLRWAYVHETWV